MKKKIVKAMSGMLMPLVRKMALATAIILGAISSFEQASAQSVPMGRGPNVGAQVTPAPGSQTLNVTNWATQQTYDLSTTQNGVNNPYGQIYRYLQNGLAPSAQLTNQYAINQGVSAYNAALAAGQTPAQATQAANSAALNALSFISSQATSNTTTNLNNLATGMTESAALGAAGAIAGGAVGGVGGAILGTAAGLGIGAFDPMGGGTFNVVTNSAMASANWQNTSGIMGSGYNLPGLPGASSGGQAPTRSPGNAPATAPVNNGVGSSAIGTPLGNAVIAANGGGQAPVPAPAPVPGSGATQQSGGQPPKISGRVMPDNDEPVILQQPVPPIVQPSGGGQPSSPVTKGIVVSENYQAPGINPQPTPTPKTVTPPPTRRGAGGP